MGDQVRVGRRHVERDDPWRDLDPVDRERHRIAQELEADLPRQLVLGLVQVVVVLPERPHVLVEEDEVQGHLQARGVGLDGEPHVGVGAILGVEAGGEGQEQGGQHSGGPV